MKSIELSPEQQKHYNNVISLCCDIEKVMLTTVGDDPQEIQYELSNRIPYLANLPTMISTAKAIHDWAKGEAAEAIIKSELTDLKHDLLKKYMEGMLSKYSALYTRVESLEKNLRLSIEGLRSLMSYEKELANINRFSNEA